MTDKVSDMVQFAHVALPGLALFCEFSPNIADLPPRLSPMVEKQNGRRPPSPSDIYDFIPPLIILQLAGASYMEVHKAGGGIHFTVEHTRNATEDELFQLLKPRLERMLQSGTTTVECKSGYGLDTETEVKMLRVLERAKKELPIEISSTYCGAHAVPK